MEKDKSSEIEGSSKEDLDSLLDSALDDFDKPVCSSKATKTVPQQSQPSTSASCINSDGTCSEKKELDSDNASNQWAADFKNFQDVMQSLMNSDPNALGDLGGLDFGGENGEQFASSLVETLKEITEGSQSLPEPTPDELAQLLSSMGMDDAGSMRGDDQYPDVMPLMQNVMQSLLSKELLYPALKDLVNKYPDWLASKKEILEESEFGKFTTQYDLMKQVCEEFEREDLENEEEKTRSFQKILMLMQKMKDCGDPPKELMGDISPDLAALDSKQTGLPGMPEQCVIM